MRAILRSVQFGTENSERLLNRFSKLRVEKSASSNRSAAVSIAKDFLDQGCPVWCLWAPWHPPVYLESGWNHCTAGLALLLTTLIEMEVFSTGGSRGLIATCIFFSQNLIPLPIRLSFLPGSVRTRGRYAIWCHTLRQLFWVVLTAPWAFQGKRCSDVILP